LDFNAPRDDGVAVASARSRQITTPAPHHSIFYRLDALPDTQSTVSKQSAEGKNTEGIDHIASVNVYSKMAWLHSTQVQLFQYTHHNLTTQWSTAVQFTITHIERTCMQTVVNVHTKKT